MPIKDKLKLKMKHRRIEDMRFYQLRHSFDQLPLDPIKPFIEEKIRKYFRNIFNKHPKMFLNICCCTTEKLRTSRSPEFVSDLNLHSYQVNESCSTITVSTNKVKNVTELASSANKKAAPTDRKSVQNEYDWKWLEDEANCKSM